MNRKIEFILSKFVSAFTIVAMLLVLVGPQYTYASAVTSFSVLLTREKASTLSDQTITFTVPTGIAAAETMILTYDNSTSIPADLDYTDIDMKDDATELVLDGTTAGAGWKVVRTSGTVLTFTNGSTAVASGSVIEIQIGLNATSVASGDKQITNGPLGTTTLALSGTMGTAGTGAITGTASMSIIDNDQVTVSATVTQSITFDLDVGTAGNENTDTPYSVALGTISTTDTRVSGATDSVNRIMMDLSTNATGGATVTVKNANGANGLVSASVSGDNIGSADGAMIDGTENYGLCVISVTQTLGTLSKAAPYDTGTCAADSETNDIQGLTTTGESIITSAAPLSAGRAQIAVNAAVSGITVAHADYADTLTFIATGTF